MSEPQDPFGTDQGWANPPAAWPPPPEADTPSLVEDRPAPTALSLIGAGAAALLVWSMFLFLGDLSGDSQRTGGLLISLLFQAAGAALMFLARDRRSITAGVGLSAVAVVPLLIYLFVDVRNPDNTFGSAGDITGTATAILVLAALVWLIAHFFGPASRHGLFLGAALIALWLVGVVQVIDGSIDQVTPDVDTSFVPIGDDVEADDPWSDDWTDDPWTDESGSSTGGFGDISWDDNSSSQGDDPSTRLGVVSLLFGGGYLLLGAIGDRRGRTRQATPLFAASIPILTLAVPFLGDTLDVEGASMLAIGLGCTAAWLGARATRRFTAWYGTGAAALGVIAFVNSSATDSVRVQAAILLMLGLALAAAAIAFEGGSTGRRGPVPGSGPGPADQTPAWPAPPADQAPPVAQSPHGLQAPPASQAPPTWQPPAQPTQPDAGQEPGTTTPDRPETGS